MPHRQQQQHQQQDQQQPPQQRYASPTPPSPGRQPAHKTAASAAATVRQNVLGVANAAQRGSACASHAEPGYSPPPPVAVGAGHGYEPSEDERRWEEERRRGARTPTEGSYGGEGAHEEGGQGEEGGGGDGIMETVVLPVMDSIHDRVTNPAARASILRLRKAIEQAEREVPGLLNVLISEIVDSVEPEPDDI